MTARLVSIGLMAAVLSGCQPSGGDDAAFGARVHAYLLAHPEVIQESAQRLQAKFAADDEATMRNGRAQIPRLRSAIERDPADLVANPGGRVTVTEFYDYRCPHCVNAAPKVLDLIRTHPEVRFVFKEMPDLRPDLGARRAGRRWRCGRRGATAWPSTAS